MNGIFLSIISGISFGLFQTVNRRAGRQGDVFQATFILVLVSSVLLVAVLFFFEDLSLLRTISWPAFFFYSLAAFFHFFIGWTLLVISQKEVGAARTSVLLGTVPLWATFIGIFFFDEFLSASSLLAIGLIILGAYIVSSGKSTQVNSMIKTGWWASLPGLGTAICFASSAIFIRYGLNHLPSPLLGVTIGMVVVTIFYGLLLLIRSQTHQAPAASRFTGSALWLQIIAGVLVALGTWWRWVALDLTQIAIVISLSRLSTPTVLLASPFLIGQQWEEVNGRVWLGAASIIAGALILTFYS